MTITARDGYVDIVRDRVENFHGNQLVYVAWDDHLLFSAAQTFSLPPAMSFQVLISEVLPTVFDHHPDFKHIKWAAVKWSLDGEPLEPDMDGSLEHNGVGHK